MERDIRKKFPHLLPLNNELTEFDGYLTAQGQDFRLHVTVDVDNKIFISGNWMLRRLLNHEDLVLRKTSSLVSFLQEVQSMLELQLKKTQVPKNTVLPISYYGTILQQIQKLGWDKVSYIDEDLKVIQLQVTDESGRSHTLKLTFPYTFPDKEVHCVTDLPVPFEIKWKKSTTLSEVYDEFKRSLVPLQLFWNCMDELSQKTWVLEPENPSTRDCKRRLALSSNSSIQITVNPFEPTLVPGYDFLGPEQVVVVLMDTIQKNIDQWDSGKGLLENLTQVLEVKFPSPENTTKEDLKQDCGICYAYVFEDALPDRMCDNTHCGQPFHQCCLYEWLRAVPSTRQSFDILFGECPYCSKPISCKMV